VTVGEYLDSWLKDSMRGSVRQSTLDRYEIAVRVHIKPALVRLKLRKLTPARLADFYQDRLAAGLAPASVNKLHVTLHKALDQAAHWRMVPRNVAEAVKAPRPAPPEMQTLMAAQTRKLLEAAKGERLEALYVLAVQTGMRLGELLALKWQDIDLENATVGVRRTITTKTTPAYRFISFAVARLLSGKRRNQMHEAPLPGRSGQETPRIIEDVLAATSLISGMAKNGKKGCSRTALVYYWCTKG
jgi:integrase